MLPSVAKSGTELKQDTDESEIDTGDVGKVCGPLGALCLFFLKALKGDIFQLAPCTKFSENYLVVSRYLELKTDRWANILNLNSM